MSGSYLAGPPREAGQGGKKAHLLRCPRPLSLDVHSKYASLLGSEFILSLSKEAPCV